jgi:hypothetical protein
MEAVVSAVQTMVNNILTSAPTVLGAALGLFAVIYGARFVLRLIKTASK